MAIQSVKTIIRMIVSSIFMVDIVEGSLSFPCPLEQLRKLTTISMAFYTIVNQSIYLLQLPAVRFHSIPIHCKPWTHLKHSSLFAIFSFIYRVWWLKFLSFNIFPSFPHLRILFISDLQNWDWKLCKNSNPGESGLDQEKFLHYPGYQICWKQKIKGWIRCSSNKSLICQFSFFLFLFYWSGIWFLLHSNIKYIQILYITYQTSWQGRDYEIQINIFKSRYVCF